MQYDNETKIFLTGSAAGSSRCTGIRITKKKKAKEKFGTSYNLSLPFSSACRGSGKGFFFDGALVFDLRINETMTARIVKRRSTAPIIIAIHAHFGK